MHRLIRGNAPPCLSGFKHGQDNWKDVEFSDKSEIRTHLEQMQGMRCAYCECELRENNQHIEHFKQKGRDPRVTFLWSNLFWSCKRLDSCGKHKDQKAAAYEDGDLIKPDIEDPHDLLLFLSDGSIVPREGISESEKFRATETLRVFNLAPRHGTLRALRREAARPYLNTADEINSLFESGEATREQCRELLKEEIELAETNAFISVIRHTLLPVELL